MDNGSEFVVLAKLKASRSFLSFSKNKYVFVTVKTFKGLNIDQLEVWTSKFESACGLQPSRNVPYVLFVYREGSKLKVDNCSSWPLSKNNYDYNRAFNEFYKLKNSEALKPDSRE